MKQHGYLEYYIYNFITKLTDEFIKRGGLMNSNEMNKILEQHEIWIFSRGKNGEKADLKNAKLGDAELSGVNLRSANLRGADLGSVDLRGADLNDADLRGANLRGSNLRGADLRGANLRGADLREANLRGTDLKSASLKGADLKGSDLKGADLDYTDLSSADLSNADLRGVDLNNADLQDINLTSTDLPESTFIIFGEKYFISICGDNVRVGCEVHSASEWRQFSKQDIIDMGDDWLKFHSRLLDIIDFYCGKGERPEWLKAQNNDL